MVIRLIGEDLFEMWNKTLLQKNIPLAISGTHTQLFADRIPDATAKYTIARLNRVVLLDQSDNIDTKAALL